MYEIRLTTQAKRAYLHLDSKTRNRVDHVLEKLESGEFQHNNIKSLKGALSHCLRYRLDDWRIVFAINHEKKIVIIESITTRGGSYR